jgi:hypothetical protein
MTVSTARAFSLESAAAVSESEFFSAPDPLAGIPQFQEEETTLTQTATPMRLTRCSVFLIHGLKERVKARFRLLKRLGLNHDGEGASAPIPKTVDAAIAFVDRMTKYKQFFATLDDDGSAVIEFEDKAAGFFADITFLPDGRIECYRRKTGLPSRTFVGDLSAADARDFLENELGIDF